MGSANPSTTLLVDDEPDARRLMQLLLADYPEFQVIGEAANVADAMLIMERHLPDLVFLDIEMPGGDGFELIRQMHQRHMEAEVIFVTAYNHYAIEAIKAAALDYLLKPVDEAQLRTAISRFKCKQKKAGGGGYDKLIHYLEHPHRIRINVRSGFILIDPSEVVYIQADGNYTEVFLRDGKAELSSTNLGTILNDLPTADFLRISRSLSININYLVRVNRLKHFCVMRLDGKEISLKITRQHLKKLDDWVADRIQHS